MAERRWPTLSERLARPPDVLDETSVLVRPSPEQMDALRAEAEAWLAEHDLARQGWPTIPEVIADAARGVLDDTSLRVRPTADERAAIRAEAEAFLAERLPARKQRPLKPPAGRAAPPARRPA
jgi:hypothetical protein